MEIVQDPEFKKQIELRLAQKRNSQNEARVDGLHLTALTYCITKAYWDVKLRPKQVEGEPQPVAFQFDEKTLHMFAIGFGLEQVLLEEPDDKHRVEPKQWEGMWVSPDYVMTGDSGEFGELKSTRLGFNRGEPRYPWPANWIRQMLGYALAYGQSVYHLAVFLVIPAELHTRKFIFSAEDRAQFYDWLMWRRDKLLEAFETMEKPPEPFKYNMKWECKNCPAITYCQLAESSGVFHPAGEEPPLPKEAQA